MKRTDATDNLANQFTDGNPGLGVPATVVEETWLNNVQEELCDVIENAGITLNGSVQTQLRAAINRMVGQGSPLSKVFADSGFTVTKANRTVLWNDTGGVCICNLPAASTVAGLVWQIGKTSGGNKVSVTPNGTDNINGVNAAKDIENAYTLNAFYSTGTEWIVLW